MIYKWIQTKNRYVRFTRIQILRIRWIFYQKLLFEWIHN